MGQAMTQKQFFEELRDEQDRLREEAGYLEQAKARQVAPVRRAVTTGPSRQRLFFGVAAALAVAAAVAVWQGRGVVGSSAPSFALGESGQRGVAGAFVAAPGDR